MINSDTVIIFSSVPLDHLDQLSIFQFRCRASHDGSRAPIIHGRGRGTAPPWHTFAGASARYQLIYLMRQPSSQLFPVLSSVSSCWICDCFVGNTYRINLRFATLSALWPTSQKLRGNRLGFFFADCSFGNSPIRTRFMVFCKCFDDSLTVLLFCLEMWLIWFVRDGSTRKVRLEN